MLKGEILGVASCEWGRHHNLQKVAKKMDTLFMDEKKQRDLIVNGEEREREELDEIEVEYDVGIDIQYQITLSGCGMN